MLRISPLESLTSRAKIGGMGRQTPRCFGFKRNGRRRNSPTAPGPPIFVPYVLGGQTARVAMLWPALHHFQR